ncbi:DNA-binding response regulator [Marispirochaeta aestuarii]|uniref:DNA-binding response regulator n=1 Tax=Marispirochaeta aestuarii TaxID=1963862 RepID=A0A1Y1RY59_9SPIO|nr:response regulator transcription factor [Marispirochaeta aestuarii]ORC35398.1 DNA-binding response regulator [Marispirochaeta aestuarii]
MLRVLIADDHPVLRRGLIQLMEESLSVSGIYETGKGCDVLSMLRKNPVDVLILDISLPDKDGMIVLAEVKQEFPDLPVLMLSIQPETQYAARALRLGAAGCLNKATAPEELVRALRQVARGEHYMNETTSSILLETIRHPGTALPHELLSERETQVMLSIASGKTLSEIADELYISVKTVSTYRSRLLEKMNLKNNAQLTQYVFRHKLMPMG